MRTRSIDASLIRCNVFIPLVFYQDNICWSIQCNWLMRSFRRSRPEVFCQKGVLGNCAKFTGKHMRQYLFLNKVPGLRPATIFKKRLLDRYFPVNFAKILRSLFYVKHLWWLLLYLPIYNLLNTKFCLDLKLVTLLYQHSLLAWFFFALFSKFFWIIQCTF